MSWRSYYDREIQLTKSSLGKPMMTTHEGSLILRRYLMWTWKTESAADWSMQAGITYGGLQVWLPLNIPGWIPTPITAKPHGSVFIASTQL